MQEEKKYLEELFQKYLQGQVTEEEKAVIARWLVNLDVSDKKLAANELQGKQQLSQAALKDHFFSADSGSKIIRFPFWLKTVAASLLIMLTAGSIFYVINKKQPSAVTQIAFEEMATKMGEMKIVTLTDGTRITLNNQSKIKYPVTFTGKTREVYLTGEAFFEVAHDTAKPFKVHADKLNVQVLGTSFDIKAYTENKRLYVSVSSGKVGVLPITKGTETYFLLPGDQLAYNRATGKFKTSKVELSSIAAWQKGILTFNNETLASVTHQLERFYKVTFQFENKNLLKKELTLKVKNQSLETVMKALSISGDFHYKTQGDKVRIGR